jgi:hypothetical protein
LTGASIVNISLYTFRGLGGLYDRPQSGLKTLSLASNALDKFPSASLKLLSHLEHLLIGGNFIERLDSNDLNGLGLLISLDLSLSQNLVHLGAGLLANNRHLVAFSVSGCHQLSIEASAFTLVASYEAAAASKSRQLELRLSDLGWSQVPSNIVDWTQVVSIDLTDNPLHCDCNLVWLKDVLASIEAANMTSDDNSQVVCDSPYEVKGQLIQVILI